MMKTLLTGLTLGLVVATAPARADDIVRYRGTIEAIDGSTLTLTAHRTALSEEGVSWLASERFAGTYKRQLSISDDIDAQQIEASYDNGVLTVTLPIAEKAKPRRIEVSSGPPSRTDNAGSTTQVQIEA